jgi:hypothetical protein
MMKALNLVADGQRRIMTFKIRKEIQGTRTPSPNLIQYVSERNRSQVRAGQPKDVLHPDRLTDDLDD